MRNKKGIGVKSKHQVFHIAGNGRKITEIQTPASSIIVLRETDKYFSVSTLPK